MKLRRIPFILAATLVLVALPIWGTETIGNLAAELPCDEGDGINMGYFDDELPYEDAGAPDDDFAHINLANDLYLLSNNAQSDPRILFSVYGYGYLAVTDANGGSIATGTYLAPGTRVNVRADNSEGSGFVFSGWEVNGMSYPGLAQPRTRTFVVEENLYVTAIFLDGFQGWPDDSVNPSDNTVSQINISNVTNNNVSNPNASALETRFAVVFDVNGGTLPAGTQAMQSLQLNAVMTSLPVPTRAGYLFGGWKLDGAIAHPPVTIVRDITLEAHWIKSPSQNNNNQTNPSTVNEDDYHVVAFNPAPGTFTSGETGIRVGLYGSRITDMPQAPTRENYNFEGWELPTGHVFTGQLTITDSMTLTAVWNPSTSSPAPSATPNPSASPSPTPAPGSAARPNPQTSPIQISFLIFAMVLTAGLATFGILKLNRRQVVADGKYRADMTRYNREKRLMNMMDEDR